MRLFLTSTCVSENLAPRFLKLLDKTPQATKFYFIPTATDVEESKTYTVKSLDDFAQLGINPIWYPLRFKTKETIRRELADADVIWVGGGNTFYLLDTARKTGFLEVVSDLVRTKNVLYGGTSAGTILATPSIEISGWGPDADPNNVGLTEFGSLGFVNFLTQVHFNAAVHKTMLTSRKGALPIYAIPDGGAVIIENDKIETSGGVEII